MSVSSPVLAANILLVVDWLQSAGTYRVRLDPSGRSAQWVSDVGERRALDHAPELGIGTRLLIFLVSPFIDEQLL